MDVIKSRIKRHGPSEKMLNAFSCWYDNAHDNNSSQTHTYESTYMTKLYCVNLLVSYLVITWGNIRREKERFVLRILHFKLDEIILAEIFANSIKFSHVYGITNNHSSCKFVAMDLWSRSLDHRSTKAYDFLLRIIHLLPWVAVCNSIFCFENLCL